MKFISLLAARTSVRLAAVCLGSVFIVTAWAQSVSAVSADTDKDGLPIAPTPIALPSGAAGTPAARPTSAAARPSALALSDDSVSLPSLETGASRGSMRSVLVPQQDIRVSCRAAGIIARYYVQEGDRVKKDQPIMELTSEAEQIDYANAQALNEGAQADLERAKRDFARADGLRNDKDFKNIISEKQYDEVRGQVALATSRSKQAAAGLQSAKLKLDDRIVRSPIDGMMLKKSKNVGEAVERFEPVVRVCDDNRLDLVIYCGVNMFGTIRKQLELPVEILEGPGQGKRLMARVDRVDPFIDPATGTFRVRLSVLPSEIAAPGLAVKMIAPTASEAAASNR